MSKCDKYNPARYAMAIKIAQAISYDIEAREANGEMFFSTYIPKFDYLSSEYKTVIKEGMSDITLEEVKKAFKMLAGLKNEYEKYAVAAYNGGKVPQTRDEEIGELTTYLNSETVACSKLKSEEEKKNKLSFSQLDDEQRKRAWELLDKYSFGDVTTLMEKILSKELAKGQHDPEVIDAYFNAVQDVTEDTYERVTGKTVRSKNAYLILRGYEKDH